MKIRQITDSRNQHIVAVEQEGELRCYFKWHTQEAASTTYASLRRDIANHGESVVDFNTLPKITRRTARSGRTIYDVTE